MHVSCCWSTEEVGDTLGGAWWSSYTEVDEHKGYEGKGKWIS